MGYLITIAVLALLVIIVLVRSVRIVPQARAGIVERLGRYARTLGPGLSLLVPFVDKVRYTIDLREQVVSFPPQPVITEDNLVVSIDTVIYFQVTDPVRATYEIANYIQAIEQLTMTSLRNIVGGMDLERTLTSREEINTELRGVLDDATGKWGVRVNRVELKGIDPPPSIQDSMEKQMRADRDKRAQVLNAEGVRQSAILTAEGEKQSSILRAEGERESQILSAQAKRESEILQAQGQAQAITTVFGAIHNGRPTQELLSYQYLQMLPQIAQGDANKVWIVPSELGKALEGLGNLAGSLGGGLAGTQDGGDGGNGDAPAAIAAPPTPAAAVEAEERTDEAVRTARGEVAAAIAAAEEAAKGGPSSMTRPAGGAATGSGGSTDEGSASGAGGSGGGAAGAAAPSSGLGRPPRTSPDQASPDPASPDLGTGQAGPAPEER